MHGIAKESQSVPGYDPLHGGRPATPPRCAVAVSLVLGGLSVFAVVVSHLALADIRQGESDLRLEWGALRVAFMMIVVFQVWALGTLWRVFRALRRTSRRHFSVLGWELS